jgi:hypothetical protein
MRSLILIATAAPGSAVDMQVATNCFGHGRLIRPIQSWL